MITDGEERRIHEKKRGVRALVRRCCRPLRRYRRRAQRKRAIAAATNSDAVKYIIGLSLKNEQDLTQRETDLRTVILADRWSSVNTTEFHVAKSREETLEIVDLEQDAEDDPERRALAARRRSEQRMRAQAVADAILDSCLSQDRNSKVAVEVIIKKDVMMVFGEVTTFAVLFTTDAGDWSILFDFVSSDGANSSHFVVV